MPVYKFQAAIGSGELTAPDAVVYTGHGWLCDLLIVTDGTNAARAILKDEITDTGTVMVELTAVGPAHYAAFTWNFPRKFSNGIFLDINGTGASAFVTYIPGNVG